jgi:osmotically-inducible protein OsmY
MRVTWTAVALFTVLALSAHDALRAQLGTAGTLGTTGGSSGSRGSSSMGGLGGASGMGSSGMGGTLSAGQRTLMGGGSSGMGTGGTGTGTMGTMNRFNVMGRRPGDFVGANSKDVQSINQQLLGALGGRTTLGGMTGMQGLQGMRGNSYNNRPRTQGMQPQGLGGMGQGQGALRASLRPAFEYTQPTPATITQNLTRKLEASPTLKARLPVAVSVQGQTATLRGEVATEHDRVLAEQLVRLEPGIWKVQNELVVKSKAAKSADPAKPAPATPLP